MVENEDCQLKLRRPKSFEKFSPHFESRRTADRADKQIVKLHHFDTDLEFSSRASSRSPGMEQLSNQ